MRVQVENLDLDLSMEEIRDGDLEEQDLVGDIGNVDDDEVMDDVVDRDHVGDRDDVDTDEDDVDTDEEDPREPGQYFADGGDDGGDGFPQFVEHCGMNVPIRLVIDGKFIFI